MSPRPFQDEAGEINNTHNYSHHPKVVEKIEITLDASIESPPQSPKERRVAQSPQQRAEEYDYSTIFSYYLFTITQLNILNPNI